MADRPRILVLFGSVVLFGAERGNLEALRVLKKLGAEILCLVLDERWNTTVPPALDERGFAWRRVPYVRIGKGLRWFDLLWANPSRLIRANIGFVRTVREFKPTHIHAYAQSHVANFFIGLLCTRAALVFRAGDEPALHNWFWRVTWTFTIWRAASFVANSQFVARSLRANGVPKEKITVIYNSPPSRSLQEHSQLELQVPADARVFAYIGQIAEHKGPHVLIEAFQELAGEFPRAHLFVAGRISEWDGDAWARALRERTSGNPMLQGRVTFLGQIEGVPALLARCEALVVPSLFDDPSPNVVMEAKQAGRAVIAFPRGGLPELVEDGVDGIVCREVSTSALVKALRAYLENPGMAQRHGEAAAVAGARFGNGCFDVSWRTVYEQADPAMRSNSDVV